MHFTPQEIQTDINNLIGLMEKEVFCQVANRSSSDVHIRTMRLYAITSSGHLDFLSRTDTPKWESLENDSNQVALCLFHPTFGQIIAEGHVILKTKETHQVEVAGYWEGLPEAIKQIYLTNSLLRSGEVPDCFGVISMEAYLWDVLKLHPQNYLKSSRVLYKLKNNEWCAQTINVVS